MPHDAGEKGEKIIISRNAEHLELRATHDHEYALLPLMQLASTFAELYFLFSFIFFQSGFYTPTPTLTLI